MRINQSTAISTLNVLLVPYEKKHVATYHEWMKDAEIQEATASEPLTLEQEHEMQRSWRQDADKLTFIICCPIKDEDRRRGSAECDCPEDMLGDVNIFLSDSPEDPNATIAEFELMVAVKSARRKGYGHASFHAMLRYVAAHESEIMDEFWSDRRSDRCSNRAGIEYLKVKIGEANEGSIRFFEALGFTKVSDTVDFFGEFELRLPWRTDGTNCSSFTERDCLGYVEMPYAAEC